METDTQKLFRSSEVSFENSWNYEADSGGAVYRDLIGGEQNDPWRLCTTVFPKHLINYGVWMMQWKFVAALA